MESLPNEVYDHILELCQQDDRLADDGDYVKALEQHWPAWDLLPEPKTKWEAATWILAAIADANFWLEDFVAAKDNLATAMHCPDAIGNPFRNRSPLRNWRS